MATDLRSEAAEWLESLLSMVRRAASPQTLIQHAACRSKMVLLTF